MGEPEDTTAPNTEPTAAQPVSAPPAAPAADLEAGTMVEHFRVMRLLGRGGMGEVYLARDTKLGRKVALKVIHPRYLGSSTAAGRFLSEARTTAKFNHPNIVAIHAVGEHAGRPYVALEHLEGQNLRQRMTERRPSVPEAIRVVTAIADALTEAHRHGILHRDLKPGNVMIPADGRIRVVDFGLARPIGAPGAGTAPTSAPSPPSRWRRPPSSEDPYADRDPEDDEPEPPPEVATWTAGTPGYMAPEQWRGVECTTAADIWALGVILFELCAGRHPFPGIAAERAVLVTSQAPAPSLEGPDVSVELAEICARCLAKDAARRPTAAEVADALRGLVRATRTGSSDLESPFRGLLAFTERQSDLFFGRDAEIAAFVERTRHSPVLFVVGPSGAGKSSFVQAGVIPRLREQEPWTVLALRPGTRPFMGLAASLIRGERESSESASDVTRSERDRAQAEEPSALAEALRQTPRLLSLRLRALAEQQRAKVLLFVDQLEELASHGADGETARRFMEAVCTAADDAQEPVRAVFTLRDDFLGRLVTGPEVREALQQVVVVQSLDAEGLRQGLERPVEAVAYRWEDADLVSEMIEAVRGEPASLPLLQFTARLLWERRDATKRVLLRSAYEEIGGVAGALARHADGVLAGFSHGEHEIARTLLLRLVVTTSGQRARKITTREDALAGLGAEAESVLARLVQARLVTVTRGREGGRTAARFELAHESLMRAWKTLARWLDESGEEMAFVSEVTQAAELWDRRGRRDEELWHGAALEDALRAARRATRELPAAAAEFLEQGRARAAARLRQRRLLLGAAGTALVVVAAGAGTAAIVISEKQRDAQAARQRAEVERTRAEDQRAEALRESARAARTGGDMLAARAQLRMALEAKDDPAGRALWWQLQGEPQLWSKTMPGTAYVVDVSAGGDLVVVACQDRSVYVLDKATGVQRALRGHSEQVVSVALSSDSKMIASSSFKGDLRLWDTASGAEIGVLGGHGDRVDGLAFSPDASLVASAGDDAKVVLWSVSDRRAVLTLPHPAPAHDVAFTPDGKRLVTACDDGKVRVFDVATGREERAFSGGTGSVSALAVHPDAHRVATASGDAVARVYDLNAGTLVRQVIGHAERVRDVAFASGGGALVTGGDDETVKVWTDDGAELVRTLATEFPVKQVDVAADGRHVAATARYRVTLWDAARKLGEGTPPATLGGFYDVRFAPDGETLAATSSNGAIVFFDRTSGEAGRELVHGGRVWGSDFDPRGHRLASAGNDRLVRLWDLDTMTELRALTGHADSVNEVAFSPDGKEIVSCSSDRTARIWSADTGETVRVLSGHAGPVQGCAFSPDGALVATAGGDRTVRLWDRASGKTTKVLEGHAAGAYSVAFGPDGRNLASGGSDKTLRLWDVETGTGKILGTYPGRVYRVAFRPGTGVLGMSSSDATAHLVDLATGRETVLRGHGDEINTVDFSPDGRFAATASDEWTVRLWSADSGEPVWRAPLLVGHPPELYSHRGWERLDGERGSPVPAAWREAVATRALGGSAWTDEGGRRHLCLVERGSKLAVWDLAADRAVGEHTLEGLESVRAMPGGCAARARDAVWIVLADGEPSKLALPSPPTAMSWSDSQLLVAAGAEAISYSERGDVVGRHAIEPNAAALTFAGAPDARVLVVAYRDGTIRVLGAGAEPKSLEQPETMIPTRIVAGPMSTVIVGYAVGRIALYSLADGKQLGSAQLHGSVVHLALERGALYAATDLGWHVRWNLADLERDRCSLLEAVWRDVPVVWQSGAAVPQPRPTDHPCARAD